MGDSRGVNASRLARPVQRAKVLRPFLLLEGPVSQGLFEEVMGYNPSYFWGPDRPVEMVSWIEAISFCNALSERAGLAPAYILDQAPELILNRPAEGYRLPLEVEWAHAANGTTGGPYPGGERWRELAWFRENANDETQPIGLKNASEWGLYDLCGNVAEWCQDQLRRYGRGLYESPKGHEPEREMLGLRAIRGGSWRTPSGQGQRWVRGQLSVHGARRSVGFRVARSWL